MSENDNNSTESSLNFVDNALAVENNGSNNTSDDNLINNGNYKLVIIEINDQSNLDEVS